MSEFWQSFGQVLLSIVLLAALLGGLLLWLAYRTLKRTNVPPGADFFTTIRAVPLSLVVAIDLLDLGLDIASAPIVFVVLSRYNLQALRNVAAVEALVPFTQPIPTLTIAWFAARMLNLGHAPGRYGRRVIDVEPIEPGDYAPRSGRR
jgi:hypothetical protein